MNEPAPTYTPDPISSERAVKGRSNAPLCDYCGQEFEPEPENLGKQRFCKATCRMKWHREIKESANMDMDSNPLETDGQFQLTLANPDPSFKCRKDGDHYFITFELTKEEWDYFVDPHINRQGMVIETTAYITHRNQPKAEEVKPRGAKPEKPKGGPLAKLAGVWCREPAFWVFLNYHVMQGYGQEFKKVSDEAGAIEAVHYVCIVKSRAELDHNKQAAARFNEYIREPYMEYLRVHGGGK